MLFYKYIQTFVPHFVSSFVFVSVFNAHRKSVNCSVIRRATETGAHRFLFLCFIYQLFTYHVKRWRGLFGARCGLLSPWYVSSTTHRPSFFYMRTGTYYGLLKSAVIFTTSPKWHCKSTNIFGNHQTKNQKSLFYQQSTTNKYVFAQIYTYFKHKIDKVCNV